MKKLKMFLASLVLSLSTVLGLATPHVFAATRTWDGGGSDNNLMTAANWSADTAPSAGDDLVFPANVAADALALTNDFTAATSFNSITFSGTTSSDSGYTISGNSMTVVAGITNSMTGSNSRLQTISMPLILNGNQSFTGGYTTISGTLTMGSSNLTVNTSEAVTISGVVSGSGTITKSGTGDLELTGNNTFTGDATVSAGNLVVRHDNGLGTTAGGTTVSSGASLYLVNASGDATYAEPLTVGGVGAGSLGALNMVSGYNSGGLVSPPYGTTTLSGAMTLSADTTMSVGQRTGKITGAITGSHAISITSTSLGTIILASSANGSSTANGTLSPEAKETTYSDDQASTPVNVNVNETVILTGSRGDITVNTAGTLKGTGTAGDVVVYGTIAPGLSPGCLNTGDLTLQDGSTYDFEVGGTTACTQYDQIKVTGTVTAGGTLNTILYNNFKPTAGQKYTIIDNDGADAVTGTFSGLAEGATVTITGASFTISYVGGDGNDVVLTALAGAPVAGLALIKNNLYVSMAVMIGLAGVIAYMARRQLKPAPSRARRR